ncbi:MAG: putative transposase, partial [bacterium]
MIIRKAFKFRLKPNKKQVEKFFQFAGCNRFVWNKALALNKENLDKKEKIFSYNKMSSLLTSWKKLEETSFLKETHSQPLQQTLKNLDTAFKDFFSKKKGFPHFKKRGVYKSFSYPQNVTVNGNHTFLLPKVGKVKFIKSREIEGLIKNSTVSLHAGNWYVSFQTKFEVKEPKHSSSSQVGIDLGITRFATLSNGDFLKPLNSFKKLEKKLAKEQIKLAKKTKFSKKWKKQKAKITKIHSKIANARNDYLHKISYFISKNHAMIA